MKRFTLLTCLVTLMLTAAGSAQVDPDPDGIGIYFDLAATTHCAQIGTYEPFELYLLLTNASAEGGVHGWECQVQYDLVLFVMGWEAMGYGGSFFTPPDFSLGLENSLPWAPAIHLLTMTCLVFSPECAWLYLAPYSIPVIPGQMAYADGADPSQIIPMHASTGGYGIPVAGVNCDCPPPVTTARASWGAVKSLYH